MQPRRAYIVDFSSDLIGVQRKVERKLVTWIATSDPVI